MHFGTVSIFLPPLPSLSLVLTFFLTKPSPPAWLVHVQEAADVERERERSEECKKKRWEPRGKESLDNRWLNRHFTRRSARRLSISSTFLRRPARMPGILRVATLQLLWLVCHLGDHLIFAFWDCLHFPSSSSFFVFSSYLFFNKPFSSSLACPCPGGGSRGKGKGAQRRM